MHGEDREEEGIAVGKQKGGGVPLHYTYNKYVFIFFSNSCLQRRLPER